MPYQSLYRRYRPRRFGEVKGQPHLVTALHNAVREERVGHAYLFSGPRGTGKTTSARILAKALNCEQLVDGEPCLQCASCQAIESGTSFDLHELDAASNNGVEAMRDLISRTGLGSPGRTRVYILDEVHMLSAGASAALLKTLEEPPSHVVFVLATTDPHKVLPTIRSRTQHYELHLAPADVVEEHVRWVAKDAGLDLSDAEIAHAVRSGGGSFRDTLSALDQVVAAGGIDDRRSSVDELLGALIDRDPGAVLAVVHAAVGAGQEPRVLGEALVLRLRDAFLGSVGVPLDHLPDIDRAQTAALIEGVDRPFLTRALEVLGAALVEMRQAADPRITLETALVRLADVTADTSAAALLERVERLERALGPGSAPPAPVGASPGPAPEQGALRTTGGPADEARRKLAQKAAASRPATSPAPATPAETVPPQPQPPPPAAEPPAPGLEVASLPSAEEIAAAWSGMVLPGLAGSAKARFGVARFVEVASGAAVFALPNDIHRQRCEEVRPDVEAALASMLGRSILMRLVVDPPASAPAPGSSTQVSGAEEEHIDLGSLIDAPAEAVRTGTDTVLEAFPGAELVKDEP